MRRTTRPSEATRSGGLTAPSRSTGWRSSESRSFSRSPPRISAPRRRTSRTRSWCSSARSRYPDAADPFPFSSFLFLAVSVSPSRQGRVSQRRCFGGAPLRPPHSGSCPSPDLRVVQHARRRRRTPATIPGHRDGGGPPGDGAHLQVLEDREGRERVVRLRDVGKPVEDQVPRRFSGDVEALEGHLAGGRSEEAEYRLDEGRFAGPIGPYDRHDFLAVESHRHAVEDFHFPI